METPTQTMTPNVILERYRKLKQNQPRLRAKEAAEQLGVTEAELLAAQVNGSSIVRLHSDVAGIITAVETLGYVMALTRNHACVHERKGSYKNISFSPHVGLVVDKDIDLRIFHKEWKSAFAVEMDSPRGVLRSLQFFDGWGEAVHKIYVFPDGNIEAYAYLVSQFRTDDQSREVFLASTPRQKSEPHPNPDSGAFLADWSELKDTHDFFGLLRRYNLSRTQALELAEGRFTTPVPNDTIDRLLNLASEQQVPIMVFVGNPGNIQIHSGTVNNIKRMNDWLNVLDPEFNLHLNTQAITRGWLVYKPTEDGTVSSLELFDANDELIVQLFGARKPGIPEREDWRTLLAEVSP